MRPTEFKQNNSVFAKDQPEYIPLPAHTDKDGIVTACWEGGFKDRLTFLFTGRMWVQLMTYGQALTPSKLSTTNPLDAKAINQQDQKDG